MKASEAEQGESARNVGLSTQVSWQLFQYSVFSGQVATGGIAIIASGIVGVSGFGVQGSGLPENDLIYSCNLSGPVTASGMNPKRLVQDIQILFSSQSGGACFPGNCTGLPHLQENAPH